MIKCFKRDKNKFQKLRYIKNANFSIRPFQKPEIAKQFQKQDSQKIGKLLKVDHHQQWSILTIKKSKNWNFKICKNSGISKIFRNSSESLKISKISGNVKISKLHWIFKNETNY